jgi:hypothetical protein
VVEVPPAQLPEERLVATTASVDARHELPRRDGPEVQRRRQPGGAVAVHPVAIVVVAFDAVGEPRVDGGAGSGFPAGSAVRSHFARDERRTVGDDALPHPIEHRHPSRSRDRVGVAVFDPTPPVRGEHAEVVP